MADAAGPGATLWLEAGVHREQAVTPLDNQRFTGAEGAVMNGARLLDGFVRDGENYVVGGQTQEGERRAAEEGLDAFPRAAYPDAVFVDDKPLQPVDSWPNWPRAGSSSTTPPTGSMSATTPPAMRSRPRSAPMPSPAAPPG
ncbi:hypothetical protein ACFQY5_13380 [Paeniroseomonas aquatica]|uniref:hypothetical protein n=1 Tax=Paeniroseomonas aquatica TaxID=373043 RepID=UPI003615C919